MQVIGEVPGGLQAVQKAKELQPDLIILDVGLPSLNGIEAARQIRKLASKSKIIFLSQESSADVVREALSLDALGLQQGGVRPQFDPGTHEHPTASATINMHQVVLGTSPRLSRSSNNSVCGTVNLVDPQSKQTEIFENTKTAGLSRFLRPGK